MAAAGTTASPSRTVVQIKSAFEMVVLSENFHFYETIGRLATHSLHVRGETLFSPTKIGLDNVWIVKEHYVFSTG